MSTIRREEFEHLEKKETSKSETMSISEFREKAVSRVFQCECGRWLRVQTQAKCECGLVWKRKGIAMVAKVASGVYMYSYL